MEIEETLRRFYGSVGHFGNIQDSNVELAMALLSCFFGLGNWIGP